MTSKMLCPCTSGKDFTACCGRFLEQGGLAKTPKQLMRSRFTAFYLGGHGEYLLNTWAPEFAKGLTALHLNQRETDWQSLEIVSKQQQGNFGEVTFKAYFLEDGEEQCHYERSRFGRRKGRWLYLDGDFQTS